MGFFDSVWKGVKKGAGALAGYYTGGLVGGAAGGLLGGGGGGGDGATPGGPPPGVDVERWKQQKAMELKDATRAMTRSEDLSRRLTDQETQLGWDRKRLAYEQDRYNKNLTGDINRIGNDREALLQLAAERGPSAAQAAHSQSRDEALRSALSQAANASASGSALANRQAMAINAAGQAQAAQGLQQGLVAEDLGFRQQQLSAREAAAGIAAQQAGFRQGQVGLAAQQYGQNMAAEMQTQNMLQGNLQNRTAADLARQGYLTQGNIAGMQDTTERRGQDIGLLAGLISAGGSAASSAANASDERFKTNVKTIGQQGLRAGDDDIGKKSKASFDEQIAVEEKKDKKRKGFFHVMSTLLSDEMNKTNVQPLTGNLPKQGVKAYADGMFGAQPTGPMLPGAEPITPIGAPQIAEPPNPMGMPPPPRRSAPVASGGGLKDKIGMFAMMCDEKAKQNVKHLGGY